MGQWLMGQWVRWVVGHRSVGQWVMGQWVMGRMGQYVSVGQWVMGQWEWVRWVSGSWVSGSDITPTCDRQKYRQSQTDKGP